MAKLRTPRVTQPLVDVLIRLKFATEMGLWTTARDLLEAAPGLQRYQVNNVLRTLVDHEIVERTRIEPYRYRVRSTMDDDRREFVEMVKQEVIDKNEGSIQESMKEIFRNDYLEKIRDLKALIAERKEEIEDLERELAKKVAEYDAFVGG